MSDFGNYLPETVSVHQIHLDTVMVVSIISLLFIIGALIAILVYASKGAKGESVPVSQWNTFYGYGLFCLFLAAISLILLLFVIGPYLWTKVKGT